jgi:hypothetical protein
MKMQNPPLSMLPAAASKELLWKEDNDMFSFLVYEDWGVSARKHTKPEDRYLE